MKPFLTKTRVAFLIFVVLVIGSLVGANRLMNGQRPQGAQHRDAPGAAEKSTANSTQHATGVVATGVFSSEDLPVPLVPSVKGEVVEVLAKTDQQVKKGQVLLRMDDRNARYELQRAENGVTQAELLVKKAEDGMKEWELRREIQLKQIEVRHEQYAEAYEATERLRKLMESKTSSTAEAEHAMAVIKARQALKAEEAEKLALKLIDHKKPTLEAEQAKSGLKEAELLRDKAKLGVEMCELKAPADGTIMQSYVAVGSKFGDQVVKPAFLFYQGGLIIKADIQQEWAHKVKEGMSAAIEDAGGSGVSWKGKVYYVARSFLPKREGAAALEGVNPFAQNQELVLECRIALDPGQPTAFLNQKVRVKIGQ
jgi:HlyD family secretion protein